MMPHTHREVAEDNELLQRVCAGCAECFAILFHRYCRQVYAIAYKTLRNQTEAEDIVQEVFLAVYLQQERYDSTRGPVRTWILQFGYFKSLLRRRYLRMRESQNLDEVSEGRELRRNSPMEHLGMNAAEWANYIESGISALDERQRHAIELIHMDGYTLQETSEVLGESLANTRNLYYRGLKALRIFLKAQTELQQAKEQRILEKKGAYRLGI